MASTGPLTVNSCVEMVVPGRDERGLYVIVLHWKGNGGRKYSQEGKEVKRATQDLGEPGCVTHKNSRSMVCMAQLSAAFLFLPC